MIQNIAASNKGLTLMEAEVSAVQDTTISAKIQGLEHKNIRLVAGFSGGLGTLIIKPAVGSKVLVADLSNGRLRDLVVLLTEQADTIEFNGGELGGLVNIQDLTDKLNGLAKTVNDLVTAFNSHTHLVSTTGTAAAQSGTAQAVQSQAQQADTFSAEDYEDTKIIH
ncbi:MAG: hypothetical protein MJZ66_02840 [Bacteroidales bacterium]|nr:hypothetical protein [Bacteroidales bacterium]